MSRVIKFRAWDTRQKHMQVWRDLYVCPVMGDSTKTVAYERHGNEWRANGDLVLMQFTGLLDKNGKEIYEGDVLKCAEWDSDETVRVIEFASNAQFLAMSKESGSYITGNFWKDSEVIGNIYENPELL